MNWLNHALFWPTYQVANPQTTPRDVKIIRDAIAQMPQGPMGVVRIDERPVHPKARRDAWTDPRVTPREIWLNRNGKRFPKGDTTDIAALITHEDEHLKGANEVEAREREIAFLQQAILGGYEGSKLLKSLSKQLGMVQAQQK